MSKKYYFEYSDQNIYGHVVELLRRASVVGRTGVHLDLGCGFGAVAEPIVAVTGLTYVGIDADPEGLASLAARGFETHEITLGDSEKNLFQLKQALGDRPLVSMSCIDLLEHVYNPKALLSIMRSLAGGHVIPLVTSVPNVSHIDVAAKQLFGKFESTDTGILDRTHLTHFTDSSIIELLKATGWQAVDAFDVEYLESDQHFPQDHVALASGSLLAKFLHSLRREADRFYITNQLVRLSVPAVPQIGTAVSPERRCFLSVLVPIESTDLNALWELCLCLSAQDYADFEVLFLCIGLNSAQQFEFSKIVDAQVADLKACCRVIPCQGRDLVRATNMIEALNIGIENVQSDYVTVVPSSSILLSNWVGTFRTLAAEHPGAVLRTAFLKQPRKKVTAPYFKHELVLADGPVESVSQSSFELYDQLAADQTPSSTFAWPVSLARDLNRRYDETLLECFSWDFYIRAVAICGVASSSIATAILSSKWCCATSAEWLRVQSKFDSIVFLLPASSAGNATHSKGGVTLISEGDHDAPLVERETLMAERDVLVSREQTLAAERDALVSRQHTLIAERDALVSTKLALISERYVLASREQTLAAERDAVVAERDALVSKQHTLIAERDALVSTKLALITERDAFVTARNILMNRVHELVAERDTLLTEHTDHTTFWRLILLRIIRVFTRMCLVFSNQRVRD
jgi:SAM-dependent methyltransferase